MNDYIFFQNSISMAMMLHAHMSQIHQKSYHIKMQTLYDIAVLREQYRRTLQFCKWL